MLSFFPPDVLAEIWDLIVCVSEGCPTYFYQSNGNSDYKENMTVNYNLNALSLLPLHNSNLPSVNMTADKMI